MKKAVRLVQNGNPRLEIRKAILEKAGFTQCSPDSPPPMTYVAPKTVAGRQVPGNKVFHNTYSGTRRPGNVNAFVSIDGNVSFSIYEEPGAHAASSLKNIRKCLKENDAVAFGELIQTLRTTHA